MGYGEFTGNKSVHWSIDYDNSRPKEGGTVRGRDPIPFRKIGRDEKRKLTPGHFRARLRYDSLDAAKRALKAAAKIQREGKNFYLVFDVPAVERERNKVDPPDPPSEIRVDW
jgi:hypothetical protein